MYRWAGAALLRASTDPGGLNLPDNPDLFGDDTAERGLAWLSEVWQREDVRAALSHASPALSQQIDDMMATGNRDARTVRRVVISVASYLLRWRQRPTPFGMFAGVGMARLGAGAKVRWGHEHRVAVRADAGWLGNVLAQLHQSPELLERLSVVVNDAGNVRGDRFVAPGPAPDGAAQALAPLEVSVRHSRPVRAALEAARTPLKFGELRALLLRRFPAAAVPQIDGMLAGLLDQRILISSLWAPMTCLDALGHACAALQ
ncbi:MAG: lantibiotic dehydratase, partial [Pseudonocardiaceae bacterium]